MNNILLFLGIRENRNLSKKIYQFKKLFRIQSKLLWTFNSNNYVNHTGLNDIYSHLYSSSPRIRKWWKWYENWVAIGIISARSLSLPLLFYFLPFQSGVARCIRDTEDERIHVERRAVVKKLYFVFERRLFETTRVSITDVCTCLKTFKWLFKYELPYVYFLKYSCMGWRVNLTLS